MNLPAIMPEFSAGRQNGQTKWPRRCCLLQNACAKGFIAESFEPANKNQKA
jgi:hypothetical protein